MISEHGENITTRGCQLDGGATNLCEVVHLKAKNSAKIRIDHCSVCEKDECNSSISFNPMMATILAFALSLLLLQF